MEPMTIIDNVAADFFNLVKPSYIENWHPRLFNLSIATVHWPLTPEQSNTILAVLEAEGRKDVDIDLAPLTSLIAEMDRRITEFPQGVFVRLGSRSPKDVIYPKDQRKFGPGEGKRAVGLLCQSERVYEDLALAKLNNYAPHIALREWVELQDWQEFRCFVKGGNLKGISQYYYWDRYSEIVENADSPRVGHQAVHVTVYPIPARAGLRGRCVREGQCSG